MNFDLAVGVHALVLRISSHCRLQQGGKKKETVLSHNIKGICRPASAREEEVAPDLVTARFSCNDERRKTHSEKRAQKQKQVQAQQLRTGAARALDYNTHA